MDASQIVTRIENFIDSNRQHNDTRRRQTADYLLAGAHLSSHTIEGLISAQAREQVADRMDTIINNLRERGESDEKIAQTILGRLRADLLGQSLGRSTNPITNAADLAVVEATRWTILQFFPTDAF